MAEKSKTNPELLQEKEQNKPGTKRKVTVEIAGAAIFIAISAAVSAVTTEILPRVPGWGIAIFDPISIIWLTCFLIFGWRSGLLCLVGGSLILFFFDPTGIGPFFKFFATLPFIVVPVIIYYIQLHMRRTEQKFGDWILKPKNYAITMILAWGLRLVLMLWTNYMLFAFILPPAMINGNPIEVINLVDLSFFGLPDVKLWDAVIIMALLINSWQSIFDIIIPYLITFKVVPKYMKIYL